MRPRVRFWPVATVTLLCGLVLSSLHAATPLNIYRQTNGLPRIEWTGVGHERFVVESSPSPLVGWEALNVTNFHRVTAAAYSQVDDLRPAASARFYRLRQLSASLPYDIGTPQLVDLYLSPSGNDENTGLDRNHPLRHLSAAWNQIPVNLTNASTGFRIHFLPGTYPCEGDCINYFADRFGTFEHPIILMAEDGLGTVTLSGGLNLANVKHLYLFDLVLQAGFEAAFGNNVLHLERGTNVLLRNVTVRGPDSIQDTNNPFQEVFKANQCRHLYVEQCDLSGTYQTVLDYFSVQYGHVINSRIHRAGGRGAYFKGGSASLVIEGNEVFDCREAGVQAGEGSNFTLMDPPWCHYEAYDIKIVNNYIHDVYGAGLSVAGGYNILMAHNTLYRIGLNDEGERSWTLAQFIRGGRVTYLEDTYPTSADALARMQYLIGLGAWGPAVVSESGEQQEWIPNKNVLVLNNVFYNPAGSHTEYSHFLVLGPSALPSTARNIPSPSLADENLQIRGNVIWNGPSASLDLIGAYTETTGCTDDNITCNPSQLLRDNFINQFEPQFVNIPAGNLRPVPGSTLANTTGVAIPNFSWAGAPTRPTVPTGEIVNWIPADRTARPRNAPIPGAWLP